MSQVKKHNNCKLFSYKKCPHLNDEIMRKATRDLPEFHGGKNYEQRSPDPSDEEVDEICSDCESFTVK